MAAVGPPGIVSNQGVGIERHDPWGAAIGGSFCLRISAILSPSCASGALAGGTTRVSRHFGGSKPEQTEQVEREGRQRGVGQQDGGERQGATAGVPVIAEAFVTKFEDGILQRPRELDGSMH